MQRDERSGHLAAPTGGARRGRHSRSGHRIYAGLILTVLLLLSTAVSVSALSYTPPQDYAIGSYGAQTVRLADIDGDTVLDMVTANANSGTPNQGSVAVLLGNGDGTFDAPVYFQVGGGAFGLVVADLNGDSKLDVVTANIFDNTVSIVLNTTASVGTPTFALAANVSGGPSNIWVAVGDLDGDLDPDIATANLGNGVSILLNQGLGVFTPGTPVATATGTTTRAVEFADIDGDSDLDIVAANYGSDNVSVLTNTGGVIFTEALVAVDSPQSIAIADGDGDGDRDMVVASGDQDSLYVLVNAPLGIFTMQGSLPTGNNPFQVVAADANGDGALDLVTGNYGTTGPDDLTGTGVSVLPSTGQGVFAPTASFPTGRRSSSVAVGDLNADGHPDLVSVSGVASVLLGGNEPPVLTTPAGPLATTEDTAIVFSSGNGNAISVADPDAGTSPVLATLTAQNGGTITLGSTANLTNLTGNGTSLVKFYATIADVNTALNGLSFTPASDFNYPQPGDPITGKGALLRIDVNDLGNSGAGPVEGLNDQELLAISVAEVNDAPTATNDDRGTYEDTAIAFSASDLTANDSAGPPNESDQTLTITAVGTPAHGIVNLAGNTVTYIPAPDYNGTDSFTYTVCDNGTTNGAAAPLCDTATVTVTITAVNDAPIAGGDSYIATAGTPLTVAAPGVLANDTDPDGETLTAVVVNTPARGNLTLNADGSFTYTPNAGYTGPDNFSYRAVDPNNAGSSVVSVGLAVITGAPGPATYTVTVSQKGSGTVTPGTQGYADGATATYAATPAAGQLFLGWTLDGRYVGFATPFDFTVNGNRTLVAQFAPRPTFSDVPTTDPDYQAITFLAAFGIINPNGVNGSGQFQPDRDVVRAEMAAFVARTFGWQKEFHANNFPDKCDPAGIAGCIDDELWNNIAALKDYGVVGGYNDPATCEAAGTTAPCYLPRDVVKRVQVISIVARAFIKAPDLRPTGFWDRLDPDASQYTNVPNTGTQRSDLTTYRANAGEIPGQSGSATFANPEGNGSRRFIIQVLYQAFNTEFGADNVP